jgi:hypothetical protein
MTRALVEARSASRPGFQASVRGVERVPALRVLCAFSLSEEAKAGESAEGRSSKFWPLMVVRGEPFEPQRGMAFKRSRVLLSGASSAASMNRVVGSKSSTPRTVLRSARCCRQSSPKTSAVVLWWRYMDPDWITGRLHRTVAQSRQMFSDAGFRYEEGASIWFSRDRDRAVSRQTVEMHTPEWFGDWLGLSRVP